MHPVPLSDHLVLPHNSHVAGDVFSASRALAPRKFELSMFEVVYINAVMFVLSFAAVAIIVNCVMSIVIDVYGCVVSIVCTSGLYIPVENLLF